MLIFTKNSLIIEGSRSGEQIDVHFLGWYKTVLWLKQRYLNLMLQTDAVLRLKLR